jgi:hypothetical protein
MNGVTYARPPPVRWICFQRTRKLMFFLLIAIMAGLAIILLFALAFPATGVLIMCILIIVTMAFEYLALGRDCSADQLTGSIQCSPE